MTFAVPTDLSSGDILTEAWVDQVRDNFTALSTWSSFTPTFTQSATITKTLIHGYYVQLGDLVIGHVKMTATSAGTVNNEIRVGLPVAHDLAANSPIGDFWFQDAGTDVKIGSLVTQGAAGGTVCNLQRDTKAATLGSTSDVVTVASSDSVGYTFIYRSQ
jgi:hypothetical protein